jgi:hypothetical protein
MSSRSRGVVLRWLVANVFSHLVKALAKLSFLSLDGLPNLFEPGRHLLELSYH